MRQRGFGLVVYLILGVAILAILSGIAYRIRESGKDAVRLEWADANRKERERLDREAAVRSSITDKREADNATAYANLDARYRAALLGLRQPLAGDGKAKPLSEAARLAHCPDGSARLVEGLARLEAEILGLLERGDRAIQRTITCKTWLEDQAKVNVK